MTKNINLMFAFFPTIENTSSDRFSYDAADATFSGEAPTLCPTMPNTSATTCATRPKTRKFDTPVVAYPYYFLCHTVDGFAFRALVCASTEKEALLSLKTGVPTNQRARVYRIACDEFASDPVLYSIGEPQWKKDLERAAIAAARIPQRRQRHARP